MKRNVSFRWKNYKGFKDTGSLEIKPITILLGSNGSGKSSIIQPLLLLSQTLQTADTCMTLMPSGEYIKAGSFPDLSHNHITKLPISFEFDVTPPRYKQIQGKPKKLGTYPPTIAEIQFSADGNMMPVLSSLKLFDCCRREMLCRKLTDSKYNLIYISELDENDPLSKEIQYQQPTHFLFSEEDIFKKAIEKNQDVKQALSFSAPVSHYIGLQSFFNSYMKDLLSSVKYIGPIREYPKRYYEYSGEFHPQVGSKGEFTFSLLFQLLKNSESKNILNKWLGEFKLTDEIYCELLENRPDLLEIYVKSNGLKINYADTCFGISQILPLLVQSLMAKDNDIVLTEQPEIHLNPNCETVLADFFVDMVTSRKVRYIIETHSEHYLMRLRTHIKTGKLNHNDVAIYMVSKSNGESKIQQITIDEQGNFPNKDWPKGFFEQALSESLMFATAKKVTHAK